MCRLRLAATRKGGGSRGRRPPHPLHKQNAITTKLSRSHHCNYKVIKYIII
ncbi:hypothetical protein O3G_MSEX013470 [Manduca sexta]|uniref:Uncharacterized protein n=1 Tax=Manduca sexta TaxID=7130 RepID=A0A922CX42_MANSE|nr:hypothetical protein O3G_MSEX013470 [Manduca sexta]